MGIFHTIPYLGIVGDMHGYSIYVYITGQWPFQEPKVEPPTYKAYFLGLCKGIYPQNIALYGTVPF